MIELCSTPQGRAFLGLKEDDLAPGTDRFLAMLQSPGKARIKIVKAMRARYAALDLPVAQRPAAFAAADMDVAAGLLAFPTAGRILDILSGGWSADREAWWTANHQVDLALVRALKGPVIPKSLSTGDLLSPFDGKPLTYTFDGKQITITVSGTDGPLPLKLPPDSAL